MAPSLPNQSQPTAHHPHQISSPHLPHIPSYKTTASPLPASTSPPISTLPYSSLPPLRCLGFTQVLVTTTTQSSQEGRMKEGRELVEGEDKEGENELMRRRGHLKREKEGNLRRPK